MRKTKKTKFSHERKIKKHEVILSIVISDTILEETLNLKPLHGIARKKNKSDQRNALKFDTDLKAHRNLWSVNDFVLIFSALCNCTNAFINNRMPRVWEGQSFSFSGACCGSKLRSNKNCDRHTKIQTRNEKQNIYHFQAYDIAIAVFLLLKSLEWH